MYKKEFPAAGGEERAVQDYSAQNMMRKILDRFNHVIKIALVDQRKGNFIYSSSLTEIDARAHLKTDIKEYEENKKLRWVALHLS